MKQKLLILKNFFFPILLRDVNSLQIYASSSVWLRVYRSDAKRLQILDIF